MARRVEHMKLIQAPASPFARKVLITLHETRQIDEVEMVRARTSPLAVDPAVRAANPLGKIPALVRNDGPALVDSRVICRYLNDRIDGNLYPPARIWEVLTLEALADGISDAAVAISYEIRLRDTVQQSEDWIAAQWSKIRDALQVIEERWMGHLAAPIDAGHIALAAALGYLDFRHDSRNWRSGLSALPAWEATFRERESVSATAPSD